MTPIWNSIFALALLAGQESAQGLSDDWHRSIGNWNGQLPNAKVGGKNFFQTIELATATTRFSLDPYVGEKLTAYPIRQETMGGGMKIGGRPVYYDGYYVPFCVASNPECNSGGGKVDALILVLADNGKPSGTRYIYYYDRLEGIQHFCEYNLSFVADVTGGGRKWKCHPSPFHSTVGKLLDISGMTVSQVYGTLEEGWRYMAPGSAGTVGDLFHAVNPPSDIHPHEVRCMINPNRPDC